MEKDPLTVDVPREFHRRMAAIIDAVQTGMWQEGVHDLLGYATDYAFGDKRGLQTLVLKTRHRSAYVRLQWETVMGDAEADRQRVDAAIKAAIAELPHVLVFDNDDLRSPFKQVAVFENGKLVSKRESIPKWLKL